MEAGLSQQVTQLTEVDVPGILYLSIGGANG